MSDVEWDADEYIPPPVTSARAVTDKWEGEDEEEDVKESWEDDEESKKNDLENQTTSTTAKKKKKKITEIVAEKEKRHLQELERRQKEKEQERRNQTPEDILAEKLRLQKIQEDADLQLASELMGEKEKSEPESLDAFDLSSSSGLSEFRIAFTKKIKTIDRLEKRPFYVTFVEDVCRDLCEKLETEDIKRVTTILNSLYNEKVKANKPVKGKKKGAGKAKLNVGQGAIADQVANNFGYDDFDEYDDFI
ncbi:Eukaryotic translation initiation factor 3 subunit J [Armadillidium nasatum]|uniref:Eukaryotic translation initiation factor 3 subunit J n=1 Tax=Armadillidium nasatum TaxID=96803 RepID=A0A5N5STQ4_9CRUS|nr:Eukaryotic translation initiation factor 3 subunit J [Armadillidium nasatum]